MLKLTAAPEKSLKRAAAFDYHAEKRALEARMQRLDESIAETMTTSAEHPSGSPARPDIPPPPAFRWRDANWGLIGAVLFSLLFWWALFTSVLPALASALHFVFDRGAAAS